MLIDASAIVAALVGEPEARGFDEAIAASAVRLTHPLSLWEAATAVSRIKRIATEAAHRDVEAWLAGGGIGVEGTGRDDAAAALAAHARYGKGRGHPANLNMADCFSYAMAKRRGLKLLYKGDDFALTDIESALG
jgi:ribonuclease VapC